MFKEVTRKLGSQLFAAGVSLRSKAKNNRGISEMVAVVVLIIIVLVVGALVFLPGTKDYFQNTVFTGMKTATANLFNYKA
jgi:hypothetical protein